jgi:hypothetical protein
LDNKPMLERTVRIDLPSVGLGEHQAVLKELADCKRQFDRMTENFFRLAELHARMSDRCWELMSEKEARLEEQ